MFSNKSGRKKTANLKKVIGILLVLISLIASIAFREIYINREDQEANPPQESTSSGEGQTITEGNLMLHMIDVGQADSFLLIQDDCIALIDCGTRSTGEDVVEYLKNMGITEIDYVIGTHPHDDHMGGMYDVITNFEIGTIIIPEIEEGEITSNWYMKLMKEIKDGNYTVDHPELKEIYNLGYASMKIIGPISEPKDNTNNYSIVLKVTFGEMDIIMTGDAEKDVEEEILASGENLDAEILKVGHHGSDTSNTKEWLDAITPQYALISTKVGNKYNHPIKSVMELLEERKIEVYRTDENGSVIATITSNNVTFNCEPGDYLSGEEVEEVKSKWLVMLQ